MYDAATGAVVGSVTTDQNTGTGARPIAVAQDGTLYIADTQENKVYLVTFDGPSVAV